MNRGIYTLFLTMSILFSGVVSAEKIVLSTVSWEPIYGQELKENGFFSALAREAFKRAGYDMEIEFMPWKRALESARLGEYDGLLGAYHNEERAKDFFYSDAVYSTDEVFIQRKGKGITYTKVEDLKPYTIGGARGGAQLEELRSMGFSIKETTEDAQSLKKLAADRIDLVLMGRAPLLYKLSNDSSLKVFNGKLDIIEPPYKSFNLYCTINKKKSNAQKIINKFNQALKQMKSDGSYNEILQRFGQI